MSDIASGSIASAYKNILEQFVDSASFLWLLRSVAINQPHYLPEDIAALEARINTHLDGLQVAPDECWEVCLEAASLEEAGEAFTLAMSAFRSLEVKKIRKAVEVGLRNDATMHGLVSALGWLPGKLCHKWIKKFFSSKDLEHKLLAVAACSVRREDPVEYLARIFTRQDCREHKRLYSRALRLVGELKRVDLLPAVQDAINSDDNSVRFWALWTSCLLGDRQAISELKPFVLTENPFQGRAIELAFRILPVTRGRRWITELAIDKSQIRNVVKASGILGDPHAVEWLISSMRTPELAKLAGESFTLITGIDLEKNNLALELPDLEMQLPSDDPGDDYIELDDDENLPWPDTDKIAATWQKYGSTFVSGERYICGKQIDAEHLALQIKNGNQRHRHAAALELALMGSSYEYVNTHANIYLISTICKPL